MAITKLTSQLRMKPQTLSHTESGYTVAQRLRHIASASLMHFPLVFKTVSDQADSVQRWFVDLREGTQLCPRRTRFMVRFRRIYEDLAKLIWSHLRPYIPW